MSPDIAWPEACDLLPTPFSSHGAKSGRGPSSGVLGVASLSRISKHYCFSSCSVPGALPASLLDSKAQEHFSHLYALVFFCKVPSILNSTSQHSSHLPPSYATAQVLRHSPLLGLSPLLVPAHIVPHRTPQSRTLVLSVPLTQKPPLPPTVSRIRLTARV